MRYGVAQDRLKELSAAKSLIISVSVIYDQIIVYQVWLCNCIKLSVDLVKSDWYISLQATVTQITAIRHWGVTNMSGVIKENPYYVVFNIIMLVMLCVFLSRVRWLPKRGPTWLHKSCFDCALMVIFRHLHHAPHPHHVHTQVTMVYIESFG